MDKNLAQRLKDAGWDQDMMAGGSVPSSGLGSGMPYLAVPSLEQLLEALARITYNVHLMNRTITWVCFGLKVGAGDHYEYEALTSLEAVAEAWIAIQEAKDG